MVRLSAAKLRALFIVFFLLLAIPAITLSWKAYEQLKWESFHQYQQAAISLAKEIDARLVEAITREESRADTDYTFLVIAGNPQAGFIQRSELSKFPVESELPGIVGYFQVDDKGQFSSPLLPVKNSQSALYGINAEEQLQRSQLEFQVRRILTENQLVSVAMGSLTSANEADLTPDPSMEIARVVAESETVASQAQVAPKRQSEDLKPLSTQALQQEYPPAISSAEEQSEQVRVLEERKKSAAALKKRQQKQESEKITITGSRIAREESQKLDFDSLQSAEVQEQISQSVGQLDQYSGADYQAPKNKKALSSPKSAINRTSRKEQNYIPAEVPLNTLSDESDSQSIQIRLFESQLEPFRFSLLASGHLVAYRQVWRNNTRLIQGAILSTDEFLSNAIEQPFISSSIAQIASLDVAYGNQILKNFIAPLNSYPRSLRKMTGEQLFEASLSEPFGQIALRFNVVQMPASSGGRFILMVAFSLMLIITFGTFILFRLTLKQSLLAQQQEDFVSSVSHELKTPLTSIRMYGEILKQGWMSDEKRLEYYDYIYKESERLSRLISNILQISKVNRQALELDVKAVELSRLISHVQSTIDSLLSQNGFILQLKFPDELRQKSIQVDEDAFMQVIINLVDNAVKYSAKAQRKEIQITLSLTDSRKLRIAVRDFGPGVPKNQMKKIFTLFYRTGDELTRETAGTGIGLALVKELAAAMNAKVAVVNRTVGAEFYVDFPVCDSPPI